MDRFQSRIEPFVTVERELWRLFILVPLCIGFHSLQLRLRDRRSICPLEADAARPAADYITMITLRDYDWLDIAPYQTEDNIYPLRDFESK